MEIIPFCVANVIVLMQGTNSFLTKINNKLSRLLK